jgi:hypothetical protein
VASKNDNDSEKVAEIRKELDGARQWHAIRELVSRLCILYYLGHQLDRKGGMGLWGTVIPPRDPSEIIDNAIGYLVRHAKSRLKQYDLRATFRPTREDDPAVSITSRVVRRWYNNWLPDSGYSQFVDMRNLNRLLTGSSFGTFYGDDDAPGGVRLASCDAAGYLTLDPAVASQELGQHDHVTESMALSVNDARNLFKNNIDAKDEIWDSDCSLANYATSQPWFGRATFLLQPGSMTSPTMGIAAHRRFSGRFKTVTWFIQNPKPHRKAGSKVAWESDWKVVKPDDEWFYGNPYLHLSCSVNPVSALGIGYVAEMIGQQNVKNLVNIWELRSGLSRSTLRFFAESGTMVNDPQNLASTEEGKVYYIKPQGGRFNESIPQVVQMPKVDFSAENLAAKAQKAMENISGIMGDLRGEQGKSREPFSSLSLRIEQAKAQLRDIAETDRQRLNVFTNNMACFGADRMARTNTKKFVDFVGPGIASPVIARVTHRTIIDTATRCSIRTAGALMSPDELRANLMAMVTAGHLSYEQYKQEMYDFTGQEESPGQDEHYQSAFEIARRILAGQHVNITPLKCDIPILMHVIKTLANKSIVEEYTEKQDRDLAVAYQLCRQILHADVGMDQATYGPNAPAPAAAKAAPGQAGPSAAPGPAAPMPQPEMAGAA